MACAIPAALREQRDEPCWLHLRLRFGGREVDFGPDGFVPVGGVTAPGVRDRVDEMESVAAFGSWRSATQDWKAVAFGIGDFDAETIVVAECEPHFDLAATVDDRVRDEFARDDCDL